MSTAVASLTMARSRPQVIEDIGLAEFVQHIQEKDSRPSTVVVCATKEKFIEQLLAACVETSATDINQQQTTEDNEHIKHDPTTTTTQKETHGLLKRPSLLQLAQSRTAKLVFCRDISHLRAYLATLAIPKSRLADNGSGESNDQANNEASLLAVLNPIGTHRFTSAFSAQGLNRTISLAVEAAHATQSRLLMVEIPSCKFHEEQNADDSYDFDTETVPAPALTSPWDEEVSILNVTTKSFGAGGRGWVGRTVTIRKIAERWCTFTTLPRQVEQA